MGALVAYRQVFDGIVVNDQIKAAVLLTVGTCTPIVKMSWWARLCPRCPTALTTCCSLTRCTLDASRAPKLQSNLPAADERC